MAKGVHSSSNAYMLVYRRRRDAQAARNVDDDDDDDDDKPMEASRLPLWVRRTVDCDNRNFESWTRDVSQRKVRFIFPLFPPQKVVMSSLNVYLV